MSTRNCRRGHPNRIDPDKWKPLIMSFRKFYGIGSNVHPSRLATGPEEAYAPWKMPGWKGMATRAVLGISNSEAPPAGGFRPRTISRGMNLAAERSTASRTVNMPS
jgi:hypothetical protein